MRISILQNVALYKSQSIVTHLSQIIDAFITQVSGPSITFSLAVPPTYDAEPIAPNSERQRHRLSCLIGDEHHRRVAPFTAYILRVTLASAADLETGAGVLPPVPRTFSLRLI